MNDYAAVLADADIDAVDICLPHHLHLQAIVDAARAGKHVLCEKPLCLTLDEARQISEEVAASGVTFMAAHNQLFSAQVSRIRQLIDQGAIGRVYHAIVVDTFAAPFTAETVGWRGVASSSGGGELIDTGYHPLYILMHLIGEEPTGVSTALPRQRLSFLQGEDTGHVLVHFGGGATGYVITSWAYGTPGLDRIVVIGERGTIRCDGTRLVLTPTEGEALVEELPERDTFAAEIEHFATSVRAGVVPLASVDDAARVLGVVLASYADARRGPSAVPPRTETDDER